MYGASGLVGGRACTELDAAGVTFALAGRDARALDRLGELFPAAGKRIASLDGVESLARAFAGARVVLNCAGPIAEIGEPVLVAALAAGAHYVDAGGDQAFLHAMYERHESTARRAGRACVQGCAVNGALGDLAAAWAAQHVCGVRDESDARTTREAPAPRLAEDKPLDELAVSYVFDELVLSPASQRAVFANLSARGLVWRRDRWDAVTPAAVRRRVNAGSALGGEREVVSFPGGDVLTLPRHVATRTAQTFVSTTRNTAATTALRLLARALPLVPRRASELLAPYKPADDEYARTRFAVIGQARRGFAAAQVAVTGADLYRTSAVIAAWVTRQLLVRTSGPLGMLAPGELFRPEPALRELAARADLAIEPSFG
ncbi:MAG TPA: saccharopine dehydrogenase NADP-binding domain-containing protein [Kofleriaceae bacterium]|nr:saccharopine dehydrogenase NADP-binding domain-containing protein [Kofleriaceae bacterium]